MDLTWGRNGAPDGCSFAAGQGQSNAPDVPAPGSLLVGLACQQQAGNRAQEPSPRTEPKNRAKEQCRPHPASNCRTLMLARRVGSTSASSWPSAFSPFFHKLCAGWEAIPRRSRRCGHTGAPREPPASPGELTGQRAPQREDEARRQGRAQGHRRRPPRAALAGVADRSPRLLRAPASKRHPRVMRNGIATSDGEPPRRPRAWRTATRACPNGDASG